MIASSRPTKVVSSSGRLWPFFSLTRRGGNPPLEILVCELEDVLALLEVLEAVGAEVAAGGPGREAMAHQLVSRLGHQCLAAPRERPDARCEAHGRSVVVGVA